MSDQQLSVSMVGVESRFLAACGYAFKIDPVSANMPQSDSLLARPPVVAELCEIPVQVTLAEAPPLSDLDIGQFGAYRFDASRSTVWIRRPAQQSAWQIEALRGPLLLHALAQRGVFVLHASAARQRGGPLIAFTANSGVGKSTLAQAAADFGWERVGDDMLPIAERAGRFVALPHLPQPKLADNQQYPADAAPSLPLAALIQLERGATASFKPLAPRKAADLLLASTVATRVFAGRSLTAHLALAAHCAGEVSAGRLIVGCMTMPHRPNDVRAAAGETLAALAAALAVDGGTESVR